MKFSTTAEVLLAALKPVLPALGRDHLLEKVAVNLDGSTITILATNHEITLKSVSEVVAELEGAVLIPAKKLSSILSNLQGKSTINLTKDGDTLLIKSGRSSFKLKTGRYEDFPFPSYSDMATITIDGDSLRACIAETKHAMANQDVRFYLNGLFLQLEDDKLTTVATDGHRLATRHVPALGNSVKAILPKASVIALEKIIGDGDVKLNIGEKSLTMQSGSITLHTRLIEGVYPDWKRVIPDNDLVANVNVADLKNVLSRVSVLSNEKFHGVRMIFSQDNLEITANNPDREEAIESMDLKYSGPSLELGFNVKYLIDALSAVSGDTCTLRLKSDSAMLIESNNESTTMQIVSGMRL